MTDTQHLPKTFLLGALGGAAGLLAMRLYWKAATALSGEDPRTLTRDGPPHALDEIDVAGQHHAEGEPSTAAAGRLAREAVTGRPPQSKQEQKRLSYGVHWSYGLAMGGLYGALRGPATPPDAAGGLAFGTLLWALGDELMVPLLGLARGPTAFPLKQHVHRLGAHLAYGLATATAAQALLGIAAPRPSPARLAWKGATTYLKWKAVAAAGRGLVGTLGRVLR